MKKYLISGLIIVSISVFGLFLAVNTTQKALAINYNLNNCYSYNGENVPFCGAQASWDSGSYTADQTLTATGTVVGSYGTTWCSTPVPGWPDAGEYYVNWVGIGYDKLQVLDPEDNYHSTDNWGNGATTPVTVSVNVNSPGEAQECFGGSPTEWGGIIGNYFPALGTFTYTADTSNAEVGTDFPLDLYVNLDYLDTAGLTVSHSSDNTCQDTTANNYGGSLPCTYPTTHTVSTGGSGCNASPETQTVNSDHTASIIFTPNDGYTINANNDFPNDSCGGSFNPANNTYTTGAISNDCEIDAVCEPIPPGNPSVTLTPNPGTIQSGGSSNLSWNSATADSCSADGWTSSTAIRGTEKVSPNTTTTYNITCTNNASGQTGSASATVTVTNIINVPTVTTSPVINITQTSATSGGTIVSNGGDIITTSGIVWGLSSNPTLANNSTTDGWSSGGPWTSNMTGLTPNTRYHVRAYATNGAGTGYGDDVSFTTLPIPPTPVNCVWSNNFAPCPTDCGQSASSQSRSPIGPYNGGLACSGSSTLDCPATQPCTPPGGSCSTTQYYGCLGGSTPDPASEQSNPSNWTWSCDNPPGTVVKTCTMSKTIPIYKEN